MTRYATVALLIAAALLRLQAEPTLSISSPVLEPGGDFPAKFTCNGANVSPELRINGVPGTAKSLALILDDSDAPGGLFTHWLVWNIDPHTVRTAENSTPPESISGTNDFGKRGYGGPCPPSGTHRYVFRVVALDTRLSLASGAKRGEFDKATAGHVVAEGELMGRYSHK